MLCLVERGGCVKASFLIYQAGRWAFWLGRRRGEEGGYAFVSLTASQVALVRGGERSIELVPHVSPHCRPFRDDSGRTHVQDASLATKGLNQLRRSMSPTQARWELENSRRKLLQAIEAAPVRALDPDQYGAAGLRSQHEDQHAGWIQRWRGERGY